MPNSRSSSPQRKKYGRLILLRHATSDYDPRCVPPPDPPLATHKNLRHDYRACVAALPRDALWYVSPLARCQATAKLLKQHGGNPKHEKEAEWLREQNCGDWHGRPIAQIWQETLRPLPGHNWHFTDAVTRPPNGESMTDVIARLTPHVNSLRQNLQKTANENIVLVTHAMVIRALLAIMLNLPPDLVLGFDIQPLSVTALTTIYNTGY
ncbi:MAG: histidine phosphatase family protein, partial [Proteobacteria bacterium]|nr:histidine phosphatase family protein [Pseudomonadota bacterium]